MFNDRNMSRRKRDEKKRLKSRRIRKMRESQRQMSPSLAPAD